MKVYRIKHSNKLSIIIYKQKIGYTLLQPCAYRMETLFLHQTFCPIYKNISKQYYQQLENNRIYNTHIHLICNIHKHTHLSTLIIIKGIQYFFVSIKSFDLCLVIIVALLTLREVHVIGSEIVIPVKTYSQTPCKFLQTCP